MLYGESIHMNTRDSNEKNVGIMPRKWEFNKC